MVLGELPVRGVLLIGIIVGQSLLLAVGTGGACLDAMSLVCHFSLFSPFLWETARYSLKYCLKEPLSPKQPTNQLEHRKWENTRPLCDSTIGKIANGMCLAIVLANRYTKF